MSTIKETFDKLKSNLTTAIIENVMNENENRIKTGILIEEMIFELQKANNEASQRETDLLTHCYSLEEEIEKLQADKTLIV